MNGGEGDCGEDQRRGAGIKALKEVQRGGAAGQRSGHRGSIASQRRSTQQGSDWKAPKQRARSANELR